MIMSKTDSKLPHMVIDGDEVSFTPGETILQVAEREGKQIPTLCNDPRLEPFGGCRLCVVAIKIKMKATRRSPRGTVFASFSFSDVPVNALTGSGYDPITQTAEVKVSVVRVEACDQ